jgi:hypothetical protein
MMAVPAAKYLVCFDKLDNDPAAEQTSVSAIVAFQPPPIDSEDSERDWVSKIDEGYRRGKEEGFASARDLFESQLDEVRRQHDQAIESARAQWAQETADKLATQISAAFQTMETQIAESIVRVLRPVILAAVRDDAIRSLATCLAKLRSGGGGRLISIAGPQALLQELQKRLPESDSSLEFLPGQMADIRVTADQTVIDTQIQSWVSALEPNAG